MAPASPNDPTLHYYQGNSSQHQLAHMRQQSQLKLGTGATAKQNQGVPAAFSSRFFCRLAIRRASSRDFSRAFRLAFLPLQHCSQVMSIWQACPRSLSHISLRLANHALAACHHLFRPSRAEPQEAGAVPLPRNSVTAMRWANSTCCLAGTASSAFQTPG